MTPLSETAVPARAGSGTRVPTERKPLAPQRGATWAIGRACAAFLMGVVVVAAAPAGAVLAEPTDQMLVSTLDSGPKANEGSYAPVMSTDGSTVAFASFATTLDPRDASAVDSDVYAKNMTTGEMSLVSTSDDDIKGNGTSETPSVTADGAIVAFRSYADNLDPVDADTLGDIYVKNVVTGDIRLVPLPTMGSRPMPSAVHLGSPRTETRSRSGHWPPISTPMTSTRCPTST